MGNIDGIKGIGPVKPTVEKPGVTLPELKADGEVSFKDVLLEAVSEVQRLQEEADTTIKQLVSGEIKDVSEVMIAVQRADTAFQTLMAVRNKVIAAYEEIMRMQI
ncbi:MAG: flagellar hook-basal body complex protein FliE [Candidatus Hydrogenedentes bacterium]|nr:flagellar hook-basal body complex protein FliE [Candidatus Hydrogenedentota bacterium]